MFKTIAFGFMVGLVVIFAAVYLGLSGWLPWKLINRTVDYGQNIDPGSLLIADQKFKLTDVKAGDLVVFKVAQTSQLVGRVTKITNNGEGNKYLLRAGSTDREYSLDGESITGRIGLAVPWLGRIISNLMSWPVIVLGLYVPAVTIIGYEINRFAKHLASYSTE